MGNFFQRLTAVRKEENRDVETTTIPQDTTANESSSTASPSPFTKGENNFVYHKNNNNNNNNIVNNNNSRYGNDKEHQEEEEIVGLPKLSSTSSSLHTTPSLSENSNFDDCSSSEQFYTPREAVQEEDVPISATEESEPGFKPPPRLNRNRKTTTKSKTVNMECVASSQIVQPSTSGPTESSDGMIPSVQITNGSQQIMDDGGPISQPTGIIESGSQQQKNGEEVEEDSIIPAVNDENVDVSSSANNKNNSNSSTQSSHKKDHRSSSVTTHQQQTKHNNNMSDGKTTNAKTPPVVPEVKIRKSTSTPSEFEDNRSSVLEKELLDIDSILLDEHESWLSLSDDGQDKSGVGRSESTVGRGGGLLENDEEDIVNWLKEAATSLQPKARQQLIRKLDAIAKKTGDTPPSSRECSVTCDVNVMEEVKEEEDSGIGLNGTGGLNVGSGGGGGSGGHDTTSGSSISPPSPTSLSSQNSAEKLALKKKGLLENSADRRLLESLTRSATNGNGEVSTPDFVRAEERMLIGSVNAAAAVVGNRNSLSPSPSPIPSFSAPVNAQSLQPPSFSSSATSPRPHQHPAPPDLNPDFNDLKLLASMQEEDLRQCLEKMNLERRRRTSSNASNEGPKQNSRPPYVTTADDTQTAPQTAPAAILLDLNGPFPGGPLLKEHSPAPSSTASSSCTTTSSNPGSSSNPHNNYANNSHSTSTYTRPNKYKTFTRKPAAAAASNNNTYKKTPTPSASATLATQSPGHRVKSSGYGPPKMTSTPKRTTQNHSLLSQGEKRLVNGGNDSGKPLSFKTTTATATANGRTTISQNGSRQSTGGGGRSSPYASPQQSLSPSHSSQQVSTPAKNNTGPASNKSPTTSGGLASRLPTPKSRSGIPRPGSRLPTPASTNPRASALRATSKLSPSPTPPPVVVDDNTNWDDGCL